LELLALDTKNRYPLGRSLNETETLMAVRDCDLMEYSYDCGWSSCPSYRDTQINFKSNATAYSCGHRSKSLNKLANAKKKTKYTHSIK
jgi:hypothetical protein